MSLENLAPAKTMMRHIYSIAQLERYFCHIHFPPHLLPKTGTGPGLDLLKRLQRYQLATVPWENFSKFYNPITTPITSLLGADELYHKFVGRGACGRLDGRGGRGGGCFENNTFFGNILRSLGYDVYSGAARVYKGHDRWTGW
jgi:arylamine N-acetyltransferase